MILMRYGDGSPWDLVCWTAQDERVRLLLLHPPLLSAVVWRGLGPVLTAAGHQVAAPDLRPARAEGWWQDAAAAALAVMPRPEAVLAHSGAGALAPVVLDRSPSARAVVLLDAVLPAGSGATTTSPVVRAAVRGLAVDGVLPPWTSWWPSQDLVDLVPDEGDRAALAAQAPRLPEAFYDVAVPAPSGWEPAVRGYVQLSPAYDDAATRAAGRGWQVHRLTGQHLDLLSHPTAVAVPVLHLLAAAAAAAAAPVD